MSINRRPVYHNPQARNWAPPAAEAPPTDHILRFHQQIPDYRPSPLVSLENEATSLRLGRVLLKDESCRFNLPAFKILGASWAIHQLLTSKLDLDADCTLAQLQQALPTLGPHVTLFAATDGNHGRAVAHVGAMLGLSVTIHVPAGLSQSTIQLIRDEGATIVQSQANYDSAVLEAHQAAEEHGDGGFLIQDTAFPGYTTVPRWIVQGYTTMLKELDDQLGDNQQIDLVVAPAGVGSFAQAVVSYMKHYRPGTRVLVIEPDTAACVYKSLYAGEPQAQNTTKTIMTGLDCGTISSIAWPQLRAGVDSSVTVSDFEAHTAVQHLHAQYHLNVGPCGGGTLAALRRLTEQDRGTLGLTESSTVILLSTEGTREYEVPRDVSVNEVVSLTQTLVHINSANPTLGGPSSAPGETEIALYITAWFQHRNIETHWIESTPGRPSIVAVSRGSGKTIGEKKGKNLMFNGHIDSVTLSAYEGDPLSGTVHEGKLYGRGSLDMKSGVAAAMIATARAQTLSLIGDVIFAGVADEENASIGTEDILRAGWTADAAIIPEPSWQQLVYAHRGFVWLDLSIYGVAAHGSRADLGIDAITKAGHFLVQLEKYAQELQSRLHDPAVGPPSVHAGMVSGGAEVSSYPALCTISVERRTVKGETVDSVVAEFQEILDNLTSSVRDFKAELHVTFSRNPFAIAKDHHFVTLVTDEVTKSLGGTEPVLRGDPAWTDLALLGDAGIPAVMWGPSGGGMHAKEEWVDVDSLELVARTLGNIAERFCK